jgi:CheY-like chemotaxis protein
MVKDSQGGPGGENKMANDAILLVDDEEIVLDVAKRMLEKIGYSVILARSGKEAIDIYKEKYDSIHLVVLDLIMPGMGAADTYDALLSIDPTVKVLLSSGYSIDRQTREILNRGCNGFIQKPFNMKHLAEKIDEILNSG